MFQCGIFFGRFLYFFNLFHLIEFSWIIQIITASHSNNEKMNGKMIFMIFSIIWGRIQEQTTNFEHLVHETWPRTCGRVVFKFYKKQTKSKNHETCQDVMIVWGLQKKFEGQKWKIKYGLPSVKKLHSAKEPLCRVPGRMALDKEFKKIKNPFFAECQAGWHSAKNLKN